MATGRGTVRTACSPDAPRRDLAARVHDAEYCSRVAGPEQAQCLETLEALEARHQEALGKQRDGDQQVRRA